MGADLLDGGRLLVDDIEDVVIECPLHRMRFDLETGKPASSATVGVDRLTTYPIRVNEGGIVEIGFDSMVISVLDF